MSCYKSKDHRVVEYRGDKRMSHSKNLEPYFADYQHADISKHSVTISESNSLLKNPKYLATIKRQSSFMFNFAAKLNCPLFTTEERRRSNVSGSQGKLQSDPSKIHICNQRCYVHTFATYPTDIQNKDVRGIAEMNRRLYRK